MGTSNAELTILGILEDQDQLVHYGTKGMKWGVRKDVIGRSSSAPKKTGAVSAKPPSKAVEKTGTIGEVKKKRKLFAKEDLSEKTDKELRDVANRKDLEDRYRKATITGTDKARKKVKDMVLKGVNDNAQKLISRGIAVGTAKALDSIFGKGAGEFMTQSGGKKKGGGSSGFDAFKKGAEGFANAQKYRTKNSDGSPLSSFPKDLVVKSTAEFID